MSPEDKGHPPIASTGTPLDFRTKVILFFLAKDLFIKYVEALESINASAAILLDPNQMGTIKHEVELVDSMGPNFVVFPFDSSRMVPTMTGCLRFPDVLLLFSYKKTIDASMDSCLFGDQVDHNRGIDLQSFCFRVLDSMRTCR